MLIKFKDASGNLINIPTIKGNDGKSFTFDDLTDAQKEELRGAKGDAFTYEDFTEEQLSALVGPRGVSIPEGGSKGQILIKRTDKDFDFTWITEEENVETLSNIDIANILNK